MSPSKSDGSGFSDHSGISLHLLLLLKSVLYYNPLHKIANVSELDD